MNAIRTRNFRRIIRTLAISAAALLIASLLAACDDAERQKLVGKWVKLSNVTQVSNNVVDGWNATAVSKDGTQSVGVTISWKRSINSSVKDGVWAQIVTVPASVGSGTAKIGDTVVDYYIR